MTTFLATLFGMAIGYWFCAFRQRNQMDSQWQAGFQAGYNKAWDDFDDDSQFYAEQSHDKI